MKRSLIKPSKGRAQHPWAQAFVPALGTERPPGRRSSAHEDKKQDRMQMPLPETSKHPKAWRTPYASASTNRLSNSFGRIGPSASKTLSILPAAWRRPSAATRRPAHGTTCGSTCDPCGATRGPCGATCGPCDLACGAAHSPCGPPQSATHSPCGPAGWATCNASARACGFSHFLTAAGHVDLPSLRFRTCVYSTVAHRYPPLTMTGVSAPRRRPTGSDARRVRAYVADPVVRRRHVQTTSSGRRFTHDSGR